MLTLVPSTDAAGAIAKVTRFDGDVIIISGRQIYKLTETGTLLYGGDRIQTRKGGVEITFNDGAIMKVQPYSSTMVQEAEEKVGWFFKTRRAVRRLSVFVGQFRFVSGQSKKKTYLQTPTAVCGLRGTEACVGYDNIDSFLMMYIGKVSINGTVDETTCGEISQAIAENNAVYNSILNAWIAFEQATTDEEKDDAYEALLAALQASLTTLLGNEHLSEDTRTVLEDAREEVNKDLEQATGTTSSTTTTTTTTSTTTTSTTTTTVYGG